MLHWDHMVSLKHRRQRWILDSKVGTLHNCNVKIFHGSYTYKKLKGLCALLILLLTIRDFHPKGMFWIQHFWSMVLRLQTSNSMPLLRVCLLHRCRSMLFRQYHLRHSFQYMWQHLGKSLDPIRFRCSSWYNFLPQPKKPKCINEINFYFVIFTLTLSVISV